MNKILGLLITTFILLFNTNSFASITDPANQSYAYSEVILQPGSGVPQGDPFIVKDDNQYVMFFFKVVNGDTRQYYQVTNDLEKNWSKAKEIPSLASYHKFVVLVDVNGKPVQIEGSYHGYASYYHGSIANKRIDHFTATSLTGKWKFDKTVIAKGASGTWDGYSADTPYALWDSQHKHIRLYYMAAPDVALADYGFAERQMLAVAFNPSGPFAKNYELPVMQPTTNAVVPAKAGIQNNSWKHGWIGGIQILQRPTGGYIMLYNAGNHRPNLPGSEPDNSAIGMAVSDSPDGPWSDFENNPVLSIQNLPASSIEANNIWRGYLVFSQERNRWYLFFNASAAQGGGELVSFARAK